MKMKSNEIYPVTYIGLNEHKEKRFIAMFEDRKDG